MQKKCKELEFTNKCVVLFPGGKSQGCFFLIIIIIQWPTCYENGATVQNDHMSGHMAEGAFINYF